MRAAKQERFHLPRSPCNLSMIVIIGGASPYSSICQRVSQACDAGALASRRG